MQQKPFSVINALRPWPLTPKSIGHILDSRGVFVWSFMMIGEKGKQLCNINHFQLSMNCDLDLWPFDTKIHRAHPRLVGSLCMTFHDNKCKGKAIMRHKPFSVINTLCHWPLTMWHILGSWGVFVWSFIKIGVKEKQLCNIMPSTKFVFFIPIHQQGAWRYSGARS